jgi:hypothetical protein
MTAKRRLIPMSEAREALDLLRSYGIDLAACAIDIRADGISVTPPADTPRNGYDEWKASKAERDRRKR